MTLLNTLDDDIADILGSDNDESPRKSKLTPNPPKPKEQTIPRQTIESQHILKSEDVDKNSKSELSIDKKPNTKRRKNMLHSQSNQSLPSRTTDISGSTSVSMRREETLSLLQSESRKSLQQNKSKHSNSDENDSDDFDFPDQTSPSKDQNNNSDNESNDSILDWLDVPRVNTQNKRKPLLPKKTPKSHLKPSKPSNDTLVTKKEKNDTKQDEDNPTSIEQWQEWLGLSEDKEEDKEFMYLAANAAKRALPVEWEKVNDNLYRNIRTNEKTMTHPLLKNIQNELKLVRNNKEQKQKEKQIQNVNKHSNTNIPLRQIATHIHSTNKSQEIMISNIQKKSKWISETVIKDTDEKNEKNDQNNKEINENIYHQQSESLMVKNLRMELHDSRNKLKKLMNDKTDLFSEIEEMNNKTEIMLNEQRQRLHHTHKMEINELQKENQELRKLNSKLMNQHQTELINLETNYKKNGIKEKQQRFNELTLIEQRSRNELLHHMELNRHTIKELKKQHENEIEMLNNMHTKQLNNLRQQSKNETQLDFLIQKMETSTINIHRLQKDIEIERDGKAKENINKLSNKLLEKFESLIQETKIERIRICEIEDKYNNKLDDITNERREINEERRELELKKNRFEKQKQIEINEIQRLKNEHNKAMKMFEEEQEIEKKQIHKQRQIFNQENERYSKIKQEFDRMKLQFEEKKHEFEMEHQNFQNKLQSVNALSRRVYQQSEIVNKMYNESKNMEEENHTVSRQLISEKKELKIMKQEILMEKHQIENERKCLEKEQLSLLTTKRDMIRQIDNMKQIKQKKQIQTDIYNKTHMTKHRDLNKINLELKELKDFVNECNKNISNYKTYLDNFKKNKRENFKISNNNNSHFNPLTMAFPLYNNNINTKSSMSFVSNSMQHSRSRSLKSLKSFSKNKQNENERNVRNENETNANLSKIDIANITPKKTPKTRVLNVSNNTNSTLQSSFVSMANIDTPITIDNKYKKTKKYSTPMPMTPTPMPMPNLSKINITQQDNQDYDNDIIDNDSDEQCKTDNNDDEKQEIHKTKH